MVNRRKSYSHTFVCVAATSLLIFGCSNYIFAEGKAETQLLRDHADPSLSSNTSAAMSADTVQTTKSENLTKEEQKENRADTVAAATGNNGTRAEINGTAGSNETHTQTGSSGTPTRTDGPKTGNNETAAVLNSTQSNNTHQTAGTAAHEQPQPPPPPQPEPDVVSIFLVSDLQYDIFPVHPDNGSLCFAGKEAEKCVGGLPALKKLMDDHRANNTQSIWLNAGNTLGGDLFRTLKFDTALEAMRLLNFNATAVGPNVFKYGGEAGRRYLDGLHQTVLVSNIDPASQRKSITFPIGKCNVSVIGYVENSELDQDIQGVSIKNYTQSVLEEVERIRKDQGNVSNLITIVIGSSSVNKSKALASNETIDFVLFSGANWSEGEKLNGSQFYWESVSKKSNKTSYVGSLRLNHSTPAGRFHVGYLKISIADNCSVANATFNVLNYANTTSSTLDVITSGLERLQSQNKSLTQNTKNLTAEGGLCSHSECSLGNLITDAMVAALDVDGAWNENVTRMGIFPAVHLQPNVTIAEGSLTVTNLYGFIDQDAYIYSVRLTGRQLKDILAISINSSGCANATDFLHVSRLLQVEYRKDHDNRSEVVSVKTVSSTSASMQLSEIDVNGSARIYNVSVPLTLLKMDSYKKLLSALNASFHYVTIVEAVARYINNTRALPLPVVGSRFVLLEPEPSPPLPPIPCASHTGTTVAVTLVVAALVVGLIFGVWRWRSIRSHLLPGYVNF